MEKPNKNTKMLPRYRIPDVRPNAQRWSSVGASTALVRSVEGSPMWTERKQVDKSTS